MAPSARPWVMQQRQSSRQRVVSLAALRLLAPLARRGLGLSGLLLRVLLATAALQGACGMARQLASFLHVLLTCGTWQWWCAVPLQGLHVASSVVCVACRRLRGAPQSRRWNFFVEVVVRCTRQIFVRNWDHCINPSVRMITLLDYHGATTAKLFHPGVCLESHTQGCPRPCTWLWFREDPTTEPTPEVVLLYFHGGGYWAFTGKSHLEYVARLVREFRGVRLRAKAVVVDTRRAPEHPWPAPVEDAMACYEWLQRGCGYRASQIVLAGDSAGGGLCLVLLLAIRDAQKSLPRCAMVVSPFTDLSRTEEQYPGPEVLGTDWLPPVAALMSGKYYVQDGDPRHPLISPKYGELHALPPVLVQAGEGELLARDSVEYARRLEAHGGSVKLEMYPEMPHVFHMFAPLGLQDARVAITRQAKFVQRIFSKGEDAQPQGPRLRVLVHNGRTQSFEDLRSVMGRQAGPAGGSALPRRTCASAASSPVLANLAARERLLEALCPPEET